ncbi:uncharacterized protein LOC130622049 [Hydractinia symbiolongicarpus]|uniref:uncharacterized protein LOC130622049 n=1 Tax=Hydractinia symbiolongicarpus TaxID=13093 RepID=UPI00255019F0|nr:uncharacterized protein LOC130622049 [Hydractinia symbiolongicarpus]
MSLLATSYRYEIEHCNAKALQKALSRQQSRIKEDELYAMRENTVDSERMANEVSKWSENLEEASDRRRTKREKNEIKEELRLGNKSSVMVRRAQLEQLLLSERKMFAEELEKLGLAFHQDRL